MATPDLTHVLIYDTDTGEIYKNLYFSEGSDNEMEFDELLDFITKNTETYEMSITHYDRRK